MWRFAQRFTSPGHLERTTSTRSIPLMALLGRRLSDQEVRDVADRLVERARANDEKTIPEVDLAIEITVVTDSLPTTRDIDRVRDVVTNLGVPVRRRVPQPS